MRRLDLPSGGEGAAWSGTEADGQSGPDRAVPAEVSDAAGGDRADMKAPRLQNGLDMVESPIDGQPASDDLLIPGWISPWATGDIEPGWDGCRIAAIRTRPKRDLRTFTPTRLPRCTASPLVGKATECVDPGVDVIRAALPTHPRGPHTHRRRPVADRRVPTTRTAQIAHCPAIAERYLLGRIETIHCPENPMEGQP